jgi:four helix bundle protein
MQDFTRLQVWQNSHERTLATYRLTQRGRHRDFPGLVSQLRRAAASIPANIAEGCGHATSREFARFLQIAMASASETEYHFILSADLGVLQRAAATSLIEDVRQVKRMLTGLLKRVRSQRGDKDTSPRARRDTDV